MVKQLNILSFEDARRDVGTREQCSGSSSKRVRHPLSHSAPTRSARMKSSSGFLPKSNSGLDSDSPMPRSRTSSVYRSRKTPHSEPDYKQSFLTDDELDCSENEEVAVAKKPSAWKKMKEKSRKKRADKKFTRQFGSSSSTPDAAAGPRAAVYKGQMGSSHKKAARMQKTAAAGVSAKTKRFAVASGKGHMKIMAGAMLTIGLILSCWFLYTPAQQLYHSVREHDKLQAEYQAIEQRNSSIQAEVDYLGTDSGIEDQAHSEMGWVKDGQQTANVYGLSKDDSDDSSFTANIVPGSVDAPATWYSPLCDALFGSL